MRALILDFDGLILDTETPEYRAWSELYAELGRDLALARWVAGVGTQGGFDPCAELERLLGRPLDHSALSARTRRRVTELLDGAVPLPGVVGLLERAAALGLCCAIASSSPRRWVEPHLERLGLRGSFRAVVCRDDVPRVKPDPALYREAVRALGAAPDEALAFEDSAHGVHAAKAAGLYCVAVPCEVTRDLDFSAADLVLRSLDELPLDHLLARARASLADRAPRSGPRRKETREVPSQARSGPKERMAWRPASFRG
jgi:HAD superfamily hydrolase (TIGR01509 family)